ERHLARLARNDWPALRRELQSDDATLHEACALIRGLDPKPGLRYDDQPTPYVVPDVLVDKVGERWRVRVNEAAMPRARLHQQYAEWFQHAHCANRESLLRELQEARWLVRNVEQRHATIQRVAEAIVLRQRRFFDYGDVALRPLMLREVAEDLEIHESTVSRATANKYMSTPRGLFEFRHFFSRELGTEAGGSCSASAVRALIRELIDAENPAQPLSDVDLTQQLAR
ncbi:RNA polymerase factor sigma-54, partial [Bordetella hinzii]|nr:RNA polymerase factor sigma-54 [Bordetella hinzii]